VSTVYILEPPLSTTEKDIRSSRHCFFLFLATPDAAVNLGHPVSTASVSANKRLFYCILFEAQE
jgi:hypothetical protein